MDITITPSRLKGSVSAPPSKSMSHRALICAALTKGICEIKNLALSEDISATIDCLRALNCIIDYDSSAKVAVINAENFLNDVNTSVLHAGESGSTLRFLIPISLLSSSCVSFSGKGRLLSRPLTPFSENFKAQGMEMTLKDDILCISGSLSGGTFTLPGDVSSQFVSGLLMSLPLLKGDSEIVITSPLESKPYVDMTIETLNHFGFYIGETTHGYYIKGGQRGHAAPYTVQGDYSQAAFFLTAAALGGEVTLRGLPLHTSQGDREILNILRQSGAEIVHEEDEISLTAKARKPVSVDASQIPDLVPVLAAYCALLNGESRIYNASRLRLKESDRLHAMAQELKSFGADIKETADGLLISGPARLKGGSFSSHNDHRIVMSLAILASLADGPVTIKGAEAVNKSYPDFFDDYKRLGGMVNEYVGT